MLLFRTLVCVLALAELTFSHPTSESIAVPFTSDITKRTSTYGFQYVGCFQDGFLSYNLNSVTAVADCLSQCEQAGLRYCGIEYYGNQCMGGQSVPNVPSPNPGSCTDLCADGSSCGGTYSIDLYQNTTTTSSCGPPSTLTIDSTGHAYCLTGIVSSGDGFQYVGCFNDGFLSINLNGVSSVADCLSQCQQAGLRYCGIEYYGNQCMGGQSVPSLPSSSPSSCNNVCPDGVSYCGGTYSIDLYQNTTTMTNCEFSKPVAVDASGHAYCLTGVLPGGSGFVDDGCFTDNGFLAQSLNSVSSAEDCLAQCQQAGYHLCGLENGGSCLGAKTLTNSLVKATSCTQLCPDSATFCGGNNVIELYKLASVPATTSSTTTRKTTSTLPLTTSQSVVTTSTTSYTSSRSSSVTSLSSSVRASTSTFGSVITATSLRTTSSTSTCRSVSLSSSSSKQPTSTFGSVTSATSLESTSVIGTLQSATTTTRSSSTTTLSKTTATATPSKTPVGSSSSSTSSPGNSPLTSTTSKTTSSYRTTSATTKTSGSSSSSSSSKSASLSSTSSKSTTSSPGPSLSSSTTTTKSTKASSSSSSTSQSASYSGTRSSSKITTSSTTASLSTSVYSSKTTQASLSTSSRTSTTRSLSSTTGTGSYSSTSLPTITVYLTQTTTQTVTLSACTATTTILSRRRF